ncbi:uncharacterized protein LOC101893576 isoform X2 [Musca domestica]|uniref:Uncharacterized protein LOC101893576 isoform X2 n=1 Tax=Musca domestica TaxID=7370 RepID=A0ABM3VPC5_MUSDO|nr:uncharacterized protein LOC101893576 isoform X2 [Musca domestica]
MSSYRSNYTPFKSSLPSSYKSSATSSSSYSSRDDIGSSTSRYTSSTLTSPTAYRPSFSGGTYRLKRDTPHTSAASSYVSRYTPSASSVTSSTTLARADSSTSDMKSMSQLKRYGSTSSSIGKYSREPSPAALEHTNRMRSRDPSPGIRSLRAQSRDPSPGMESKYKYGSSYRMNVPKTTTTASTPSTTSSYGSRYAATRTPSSTSIAEKTSTTTRTASSTSLAEKNKIYGTSSTTRTPSAASLAEKSLSYGNSSTRRTPSSTSLADKSMTYGTRQTPASSSNISYGYSSRSSASALRQTEEKPLASEGRPRNSSNQSPTSYRDYQIMEHPIPQPQIQLPEKHESPKPSSIAIKTNEVSQPEEKEEDEDSETTEESDTSEDGEPEATHPPKEPFLTITVCTRGTSPNPPGSQCTSRSTHSLAITIEKTIIRSSSKRKMLEKEMQSEDNTKVSRYAYGSRLSPFSSAGERRSPSNLRYSSSSPISTTSKSNSLSANDSRREDSTTSSSSPCRTTKTATTTVTTKSKLSPPRVGRLKSRQSSVESLSPKKPPMGPKAESPFKSPSPSSLSPGPSRLPNKDFRKSSLNVGPTDRTRKSRTPSTGTDSDFNTIDALNGALQAIQRLERSPSACSEISIASNRSARTRNLASDSKLRPRCLSKPLGSRTPPSPLSRQNSNTSIKPAKSPLPASPLAMRSNKILLTAATSSSSGTESSAPEVKKPHKKIVKKKVVKDAVAPAKGRSTTTTTTLSSSANNSDNQSSAATSSVSKRSLPQPKAIGTPTMSEKKTESSPLKKSASTSSRTDKDPLRRLKKLSSVSNFFVAQQKNANSDDQIYLESTETSGGGGSGSGGGGTSTDLDVGSSKSSKKSISLLRANETKTSKSPIPATSTNDSASTSASNRNSPAVQYTRENSASEQRSTHISKSSATKSSASATSKSKTKSKSSTAAASSGKGTSTKKPQATKMPTEQQSDSCAVTTTGTTSTGGTDSEEPSWWQDTSQQIDTSSALDCSFKDEMRFKVRHVDSDEAAWWLRNDDETTMADDLDKDDEENATATDVYNGQGTGSHEPGWWETTDDTNDPNANEYQNDKNISFSDLDYKTKQPYYHDQQEITDSETRPFPRSRLTPETDWWNDEDDDDTNAKAEELPKDKLPTPPPVSSAIQNGTIQLKICRVESQEAPWWQQEDEEQQGNVETSQDVHKPSVEAETSSATTSSSSSMSTEPKKWWMTGPTKKLFNIPRVESGEKAWWQNENSDKESQHSKQSQKREPVGKTEMAPQNSTIKKLFNLPRVESGEKAWWLEESSEGRDQRSNSQDVVQNNSDKSDQERHNLPSVSPPQNANIKKLFNIPRVESGEKAWWLEESPEKDKKRSSSQDSECLRENPSPAKQELQRQKSPKKKLFNLSRLDSDQEEEHCWQQDSQERGKTRSRSRELEEEARNRSRPDQRQPGTPTKEQGHIWSPGRRTSQSPIKQGFSHVEEEQSNETEAEPVWPQVGSYTEGPTKRIFSQQQSLEEQKERWLQERNRQYQQQASEDIFQITAAGIADPNYPHSYELNTDDDNDPHDEQPTFLPPNRADSQTELSNSFNFEYSERPPPLGQCASPVHDEGEPIEQNNEPYCSSPYDNIPMTKVQQTPPQPTTANNTTVDAMNLMPISGATDVLAADPQLTTITPESNLNNAQPEQQHLQSSTMPQSQQYHHQQPTHQRQTPPSHDYNQHHRYNQNDLRSKNDKVFISRHQNIDELLSGACRALSPIYFDNDESFQTMPPQRNMFLEEITPDQVRIHDSRAQVSYIQRMDGRDDWQPASKTPPRLEQQAIDDAALQVYKDGDFGAYLDLESSLAEQAEEIEGLNSSRKNSLVVRTQLSVRVHAIIEKLLSAEGSDLRRALFSLKQVFQEDKDLVHAFVALGGLNCLVRVGNGADQNYQNYILRALGQVMLYVDGMNGVMKHEPTMQWLYSLIASNYRSVVKTALKLLLVFVEYAESNCHVLVSAIHSVDKQQGTLPWSNIMRLLKDYDNADAELVIYAASLINKTLGGLSDQDSFYDESDLLEQQGMESVIQHYLSKPGTDIDLINQLQLYEAVLKFEDGESDGLRLPDNTLRKTQRFRSSTDTAERRKSRRHSTGTSPGNINKVLPTNSRLTPPQTILDEDSSSSTNSAEYANGVFVDKQHRDAAGVTPGLRRRRERAERHRSFLKEQQEAAAAAVAAATAANGYLNGLEKREELGQLVTAIPATVKSGDSPPESLTIIPESNGSQYQQHQPVIDSNGSNQIHAYNSHSKTNATANSPNNALLINTSSLNATNYPNNTTTTSLNGAGNSQQHHINLLSPTKQLLGTNTISIINTSFEKANTNKLQQHNVNANNKKNIFMERNAINGMMKNIQRSNSSNGSGSGNLESSENYQPNGGENNLLNYKKFENNTNRLNSYYTQINNSSSTPKNESPNKLHLQPHHTNHHSQQSSAMSPSVTTPTTPNTTLHIPTTPQKSTAGHCLSAVLSPKKALSCTSPTSAGFDFTPKTSTPIAPAAAAATTAAKQLFDDVVVPSSPFTPAYTNSATSSGPTSASTTALTSPQTSPGDYPPTSIAYNTISNTSVVPPPPPPPPPPPDLLGFLHMRPMNFYNQTSASTTTTTTNNYSNNNNNNNNIATDAVDFLKINESDSEDKKRLPQLKRDHTVKDLTQKLSNLPTSPTHEDKLQNRIVGDMSGLISKAKEGLAKSKSKGEVSRASSVDQEIKKPEPKKSENELQWEELVRNMVRPLQLCDLDFTDLNSDDDKDILAPRGPGRGVPPPPPPMGGVALPPPMLPQHIVLPPPMMTQSNTSNGSGIIPPPMLSNSGYANSSLTNSLNSSLNGSINGDTIKKSKKTVKLFWKEVREDLIPVAVGKTIWDELPPATVDTQKLEHLFESRAKDLMTKKQQEMNKSKEVIVLDHKRSNAINIAMTKLPPPRAIKAAILKMDATVVTREGIDKLLNMLPTDEEKGKIQEAQMANPELPLGSAEQFLLTLASISELPARLRLWAFRLDFDNSEREIAEPLMDLKHGIEILRSNRTFKCILSTLLSVGIFLNGAPVKGFQIEYLAKVPEVKDTVHKHSLLHHLCHIVMESGMETTDLYSEIGPITRASKADFNELAYNLAQLEHECKASWDRLKLMCKHDCPPQLQQKLVDFLADCAERIIILQIVHRRVMNRYRKFLLWLGVPQHSVADSRPNEFCRILSEFALEYRTTRERVQQQIEKKANHRERNKTRGKLIVDIAKFKTKEDKQDAELKELLGTPSSDNADGTLTWRRRRAENLRSPQMRQSEENFTDGDDEILESLVKTATKAPGNRTTPRERKRTRHADRKSLKRSRTREGFTVERLTTA